MTDQLHPDPFAPTDPWAEDWRDSAACATEDPNKMQPDVATPAQLQTALEVCDSCPVWDECRELAETTDAYGVHAGEWYGDPPADPTTELCDWCGEVERRATASYCSTTCRVRAHRARALSA